MRFAPVLIVLLLVLLNARATSANDDANKKKKKLSDHTTWAVSATTTESKYPADLVKDALMKGLAAMVSRFSPYVHWTCYYRREAQSHEPHADDKLHCCQQMYRLQEQFHESLCWKRHGCKEKKEKKEFVHYCIEELLPLPPFVAEEEHHRGGEDKASADDLFTPAFSLVGIPETADWEEQKPVRKMRQRWNQAVLLSTEKEGQWYDGKDKVVRSPLRLVTEQQVENKKTSAERQQLSSFGANVTSAIFPGKDDDQHRELHHQLTVSVPSQLVLENVASKGASSWNIDLEVLLFLPEEVYLENRDVNLTPCAQVLATTESSTSAKEKPEVECRVAWKKQTTAMHYEMPTYTSSSSDVQEVYALAVTIRPDDENGRVVQSSRYTVSWAVKIVLEDEDLLLPAPVLYQGSIRATTTKDDKNKDSDDVYSWDGGESTRSSVAFPLSTTGTREGLKNGGPWKTEL